MTIHDASYGDVEAWLANSAHRWVYDKLIIATLAGVRAAPQGVSPATSPCIWRPVCNLDGMGRGAVVSSAPASDPDAPGLFWSELLSGRHVSTDAIVRRGRVEWRAQAVGDPDGPRRFRRWTLGVEDADATTAVEAFALRHLRSYSGPLNVETIGGRLVEVHLRLTADWIRAGAYAAYPWPCRRLVGYPDFDGSVDRSSFDLYVEDEDGPRRGIGVVFGVPA